MTFLAHANLVVYEVTYQKVINYYTCLSTVYSLEIRFSLSQLSYRLYDRFLCHHFHFVMVYALTINANTVNELGVAKYSTTTESQ